MIRTSSAVFAATILSGLFYFVGQSVGRHNCAAMAQLRAAEQEAINRDIQAAMAAQTPREAACDAIFGVVVDQLGREAIEEQEGRDTWPAERGD